MSQEEQKALNRREFLKGAAAAGATLATTSVLGATPAQAAAGVPDKWDYETDVVVVGTGSGLAAAIDAADAGAKVLIVEKADHVGGFYIVAGGSCTMGGTHVQKRDGVQDDLESWYDAEMKASDNRGVPEMIRTYVEKAADTILWLENLGIKWAPISPGVLPGPIKRGHAPAQSPDYPGGEGTAGGGVAWTTVMKRRVEKQGTPILLKHRMTRIIRPDLKGPVIGIEVNTGGKTLNIKARKGVVLAPGGYTDNPRLCQSWDPRVVGPETYSDGGVAGSPPYVENTGDALLAGLDVGAQLSDMSFVSFIYLFYGSKAYWMWEPRDWTKFNLLRGRGLTLGGEGTQRLILVKNDGGRYVNEAAEYNADVPECPFTTAYLNLKERPRNVWSITDADGAANLKWTVDMFNKADPLKHMSLSPECLAVADTLPQLASKMGIDPAELEATVSRYNGFVDAGVDKDFGKPKPLYKLVKPPFFAAKLNLLRHTQVGGLRVNTRMQVLDRADLKGDAVPIDQEKVIPHLYATGECTASIGWRRVHNKIGHYISFARIAGKNAAAERRLP